MYLNDHLCSPSRDRVNQRVCKKCTKEPPKRKVKLSIVVHALLEVILGGSVYLNDHFCSPSRDRVNQRVCKKRTKGPPKWKMKPYETLHRRACPTSGNYGSKMINDLARPVNKITSAVQPNGDADQGRRLAIIIS